MSLVTTSGSIFFISFVVVLFFIYKHEKKEKDPNPLYAIIAAAVSVSLILTVCLTLFILTAAGSSFLVKWFFDLQVDVKQIIIFATIAVAYSILFDTIFKAVLNYIIGKNIASKIIYNGIRFFVMLLIGTIVSLETYTNLLFSAALTLLFLLTDVLSSQK